MKVDYVEESSVRKALAFEVEPEQVQQEIDARAKELARRVKIPGFRPGKVPLDVIKKRFKDEILGEAAEAIVNKVVFDELDGRGLKPLAPPRVEEVKLEEGQPMSFKAVFETLPLVELPDWKGLRVSASRTEGERRGRPEGDRPAARGSGPLRSGGRGARDARGRLRAARPRVAAGGAAARAAATRTR